MISRKCLIGLAIVLGVLTVPHRLNAQPTLRIYGTEGLLSAPLKECAELFRRSKGVAVTITEGIEGRWIATARQNADIVFGGSEYMMTDFMIRNRGLIDPLTRITLYCRSACILVRAGNPKEIGSMEDLTRPGIRIIEVVGAAQLGLWEDVAGILGIIPGIRANVVFSVRTSAEAIRQFRKNLGIDAWITYESLHYNMPEDSEIVLLPEGQRIARGTPFAVTNISRNREYALQFLDFLKSDEAHGIFQRWGWK
jgi:accessory colonization factor AcfC